MNSFEPVCTHSVGWEKKMAQGNQRVVLYQSFIIRLVCE
jgi:hypothetical protein